MNVMYIEDDLGITPTVKMTCDCGWVEKAFTRDFQPIAALHMEVEHTKGKIYYHGDVYVIS